MVQFLESGSDIHTQVFNQMVPGNYRIYIECGDETGDVVQGEAVFRVIHDSSSPQIARIFQTGNKMTIITTEDAVCKYSIDVDKQCGFNFDADDVESAGGGSEHKFSVTGGKKYYVKCKDDFGNVPSGCSVIVRAV